MAEHVAVRVNGEWCELPDITSIAQAVTTAAVQVEHARLGPVWVVPRSFPMRVWQGSEAAHRGFTRGAGMFDAHT